jgi:hypothetical protein
MRSHFRSRSLAGLVAVATSSLALGSCASELTRTGSSPAYVVIDSLLGASGAEPERFGTPLLSDVVTLVERDVNGTKVMVPTIYNDLGQVQMRVALKNPGTALNPTSPTATSAITFTRYHVAYRRTDGRNAPGVDVPHGFDGGVTMTVPAEGQVQFGIELVRTQAKLEAPLINMGGGGGAIIISTIAEITFYGRDQVGNEVVATGMLSVNFGDFADPASAGS